MKTKLEILKKKEENVWTTDLCNEYSVHKSVITRIIQNKNKLHNFVTKYHKFPASRTQIHKGKFEEI